MERPPRACSYGHRRGFIPSLVGYVRVDELGVGSDCDLTLHGDDITSETILRRRDLTDPVPWWIGQIVHQADVDDDLYDAPEAAGLGSIIRALGLRHEDEQVHELTATIDSLEH